MRVISHISHLVGEIGGPPAVDRVRQNPGGTGKPAWVNSPKLAPFPPTKGRSVALISVNGRMNSFESVIVMMLNLVQRGGRRRSEVTRYQSGGCVGSKIA